MFGSKKVSIACVGNIAIDIFMRTSEYAMVDIANNPIMQKAMAFEYGAKIPISDAMLSYGGGGVNSAVNFANLGEHVTLFAAVGNDLFGTDFIRYAQQHHIQTKNIHVQETMTAVSTIVAAEDTREHVAFVFRGANTTYAVSAVELEQVHPEWIYLTSIAEDMSESVLDVVFGYKEKKAEKVSIFWNPGAAQLAQGCVMLEKYLSQVTVLQVNRDEALQLLCASDPTIRMEQLAKDLHAKGPAIAVVTCSKEGAYAYDGKQLYHTPALNVEIADTTGAGDAFGSTFVMWYKTTGNITEALRAAAIQSAAVIAQPGAHQGLLSKQAIADKLHSV